MVKQIIVMCGGIGKRYGYRFKPLIKYKGRTMISYVFEALNNLKTKKVIIVANEKKYKHIKGEAERYLKKNYFIIKDPPKKFRYIISHLKNLIDDTFLLVAGNHPLPVDYLKEMINLNEREKFWVVTLYNKNLSNSSERADLTKENFLKKGNSYILQNPFICSKELLKYQIKEGFKYKIETTILSLSSKRKIKGIVFDGPAEFDNKRGFLCTNKYIDIMNGTSVLFLAGNDISNKDWLKKADKELRFLFPHRKIHYYNHWKENKKLIDFEYESNAIITKEKKELLVFAKSAGIILALKAIKEKKIKPKKCIFLGFPLCWAIKNNFDLKKWIKGYRVRTLFIQNKEDPLCKFHELKRFLLESRIKNFEIRTLNGKTHDYENFNQIKKHIVRFLFF